MSHIQIKNSESTDDTVIFFPVPQNGLTLDDLRSAFPYITSLRYEDDKNERHHHILCRDKEFQEPEGGWNKVGRLYFAVCSSISHENSRFDVFNTYRRQMRQTTESPRRSISNERKRESDTTMITVGHGHFKAGTFSRISSTSLSMCGGLVVVGPFQKTEDTSMEIKVAAYEKFCFQNRTFKQKYNSANKLVLLYPDGTIVNCLPNNKVKFSLLGYRNFLDPSKRFDRLRLFLCDKENYDLNQSFAIITDSSSEDDLPQLSSSGIRNTQQTRNTNAGESEDDDTLPLTTQVTFYYKHAVIKESFPNNSKGHVLMDYIRKELNVSVPLVMRVVESGTIFSTDDNLMSVAAQEGRVNITIDETNGTSFDDQSDQSLVLCDGNITADFEDKTCTVADNIVDYTLRKKAQTEDPVDILKAFSHNFLQGRNLDVNNDDIVDIDKNTTALFISRQHLIEDAVSEIHTAINLRWPLEVTFYGEKGEDLGGPRLEFFRLFLQSMKEIFIQNDSLIRIPEHIAQKTYYACGIITGLSVIQGGPCLDNIQNLIKDTEEGAQFKLGLQKVGIWQLLQRKPTFKYIFHRTERLTAARLLHLLDPQFHEHGSNVRIAEERTYALFIKYVRNVAAGRREAVALEKILAFVTGADAEPVMGFSQNPTIKFAEMRSTLPTASTCTKELYLPLNITGSDEEIFQTFDLAFVNEYFGLV